MARGRVGGGSTLVWAAAILFLPAVAGAATAGQEEAGIIGQVTDESGAVLPGATVTASSPALQVRSVAGITDQRGEYRLTPLPIGTYTVEYTLAGFQTVRREGVRLTVGFTARLDVRLKVGSIEETVTVSAASPVVDTRSTTATTQLTRETIELLPSSRNGIVSILAQAPGVRTLRDVGGSSLNQVPTYRVFGQAGEPFSTLEGVQTSSLQASGGQANYWDYTALEEASVRTIGNGAEVPSRGINLNAVVKSGSNEFHGSAWLNDTSKTLQSDNIDSDLAGAGITSPDSVNKRYSFNGDLGGRIIRDKLWFYQSGRRSIDDHLPLNTFMPDGSPAVAKELSWFHTEKISYQMSSSNRFVGFYMWNHKYDTSTLSQFHPWEYRGGLTTFSSTGKVEWQKLYGNSLVTSLQYGHWQYHSHYWSFSPQDVPPTLDQRTLQETGPMLTTGQRPYNPRDHFKGTTTWFRPELLAGNHEFKFGFDYTNNGFGRQYPALSADTKEPDGASSAAYFNYQLLFQNGVPFELVSLNNPANAWVVVHYLGLYGQDSWSLGRRLTLNVGARYAHDNGYVPDSCRETAMPPGHVAFPAACYPKQQFNIWNTIAPRLYASYDLLGNGKMVIKGGWGRFDHPRQLNPELDAADPQVRTQVTYLWHDFDGNKRYDPGEVNLNTNGPDFVSQSGGSNTVPNVNEREPKADEFSVSLERELMPNFAIRVSGVYSRTDSYRTANNLRPYGTYSIPVTNRDPGPDGLVATPDDPGTFVTYFEYPAALAGRAFEQFTLINDANARQTFKSIDLSAFKRFSKQWEFMASYSATRRHLPVAPILVNNAVATTSAQEFNSNTLVGDFNQNAEINTSDNEWEWNGKISGAYRLPFDVMFSGNFDHRGGYPWARQVLFRGGRTIPSITLNVEPIGTRRFPGTNQLDLRLEKTVKLSQTQRVSARINVFNVLNANTVTDLVRLSGATFMQPRSIMPPRIVEFSGSYQF